MPQSITEKKQRFARMFPPRVEKIIDQFRVIGNCSSASNYHYNSEIVAKVWIHILDSMVGAAELYGLKLEFTINGKTLSELRDEGSVQSILTQDSDASQGLLDVTQS